MQTDSLETYIRERLQQRKLLLMTHAVVGYPSLEASWQMLEIMQEAGVDLVELQMPFSEPIADGPLFVKANEGALRNGIRWQDYFGLLKRASDAFDFPVLMMGYCNTAFRMGYAAFCERLRASGGSGYIIPDLPVEEFGELWEPSAAHPLSPIMLCTPTSTDERLQEICERANGFVYCVARKGVTGKATALDVGVTKFLQRCRKFTSVPLGLGFGLSQPEHLKTLHGHVEMAIVGSALLRSWEEGGAEQYRTHLMQLAEARG